MNNELNGPMSVGREIRMLSVMGINEGWMNQLFRDGFVTIKKDIYQYIAVLRYRTGRISDTGDTECAVLKKLLGRAQEEVLKGLDLSRSALLHPDDLAGSGTSSRSVTARSCQTGGTVTAPVQTKRSRSVPARQAIVPTRSVASSPPVRQVASAPSPAGDSASLPKPSFHRWLDYLWRRRVSRVRWIGSGLWVAKLEGLPGDDWQAQGANKVEAVHALYHQARRAYHLVETAVYPPGCPPLVRRQQDATQPTL